MNTFIIASHSTFAEGLYNCLKFFKFDIDNVYYINAYVDDMEFEKSFIELVEKLRDKNLIVLTDMPGGSVNVVCLQLMKKYQYHLISGVNFPLVLELIFQNEQIEMQLHKPSFKETKTPVHLIEEKDKEPYIAIHNKDGWWTGSRILEREDLFQVYIAEDGNEIVGYLDLHVKEKVHHVFDLLVKENMREKGIGRALMQKAMMESQDGLSLEVDSENEIAYGLYKSLGFKDGLRKTTVIVKC